MVSNPFGLCVIALARGIKPALWLSERIRALGGRCGVRNADRLINGERKLTAAAVLVVTQEIARPASRAHKY